MVTEWKFVVMTLDLNQKGFKFVRLHQVYIQNTWICNCGKSLKLCVPQTKNKAQGVLKYTGIWGCVLLQGINFSQEILSYGCPLSAEKSLDRGQFSRKLLQCLKSLEMDTLFVRITLRNRHGFYVDSGRPRTKPNLSPPW